jgi:hypothetical protein
MSKKHDDPRGKQKGAQQHAEGQHGEKAHEHFLEEIHASDRADRDETGGSRGAHAHDHTPNGGHELFERRSEHDPAERASGKNRTVIAIDRHGHVAENFQVPGGAESHPAMPDSHIDPAHPDRPNPSSGLRPDEIPDRAPRS